MCSNRWECFERNVWKCIGFISVGVYLDKKAGDATLNAVAAVISLERGKTYIHRAAAGFN